jgi:2-oxoglutarate ferredoxin oxidoreductase subunit delta
MARIIVDETYCKGCGLCVGVCPRGLIELSHDTLTAKGYHPARLTDASRCTACAICATMCPDVAITVLREEEGEDVHA